MNVMGFIICILLGGVFNKLGGSSLHLALKSKIRDWGVPLCGVSAMFMLCFGSPIWIYAIFFFLMWGSLSSYFDHWGTDDVDWYEWMLVGFLIGLSALPIAWQSGRWLGFIIRIIILTVFMPFSNKLQLKIFLDKTDGVEGSRGIMYIATLPLLLI